MILIKNIYYMLSYAFKVLNEQGYKDLATEEFDNAAELLSAILIKGVYIELKRGIKKDYINKTENLSLIRGRIDVSESMKKQTFLQKQIQCFYDVISIDIYLNKIIKSTFTHLLHSDISKDRKKQIRKLLIYFTDVEIIDIYTINWKINFNKSNQTYRMIIYICNFIIKGLLQTDKVGTAKLIDFIDEQKMCTLYEKFIFEYYKKEFPNIKTEASHIKWQLDDDNDEFLPIMKSDITLSSNNKILIIDAKYYSDNMQHNFDKNKVISNNIYQIFTYVKNKDTEMKNKCEVSGMLLYAKTNSFIQPNNSYMMRGNKISVKTLDLNVEFELIKNQLNNIISEYFEK